MLKGHRLLIDFGIAEGNTLLGVVLGNLTDTSLAEFVVMDRGEHPTDAMGKIAGIAILGHVTIALMIDLFWDATHTESHTGQTAGHCLHDGVGQIFRQRGEHEHIGSLIDIDNTSLVVDIA